MYVFLWQMGPDPSIATLLTPSHLPLRCREDAKAMVEKYNANSERTPVQNQKLLDLITELTGLMVQVKVRVPVESDVFYSEERYVGLSG